MVTSIHRLHIGSPREVCMSLKPKHTFSLPPSFPAWGQCRNDRAARHRRIPGVRLRRPDRVSLASLVDHVSASAAGSSPFEIYSGPLEPHLSRVHAYRPHVTIG